ncbi:hypothetical protein MPDQ_000122 [Monascus purpureus]|uniref:Nuclear membrane fusion protein Kar5 n=1 Tax=Monascus purpureus TaxID=5098 RepID=A0A507R6Y9_MONPU|nr:hypothetical protein MPDQ_000122 [Monascus purpureus]
MKVHARSSLLSVSSYILLLSLLLHISNATTDVGSSSQEIDLVSFLNTKSQQHDAIFNEALSLLESMKSSPSCNRMAATRLVTSCQSIGGKADRNEADNYVTLDHVKSLYAARLAICELNGAGASVPPPCLSVTVPPAQKKGFFGFSTKGKSQTTMVDSMPAGTLESCLRSLESRPQWWTSYSNSRQNAVVICQAARVEIEKEELLELHRSTVENTFELNNRLQEVLRNAAAESLRHKDFLREVDAMRARDIKNATSRVGHLQMVLQSVHEEALARGEKLLDTHQRNAQANFELASSLQSSLESVLKSDIVSISQKVENFDSALAWLMGRMDLILQQEVKISEHLRDFETALEESELRAERLRESQSLQSEAIAAQFQAQETLQGNMKVAQTLLDKATATAANLQSMIDETGGRLRDSPTLRNVFSAFAPGTLCALLLSVIGAQNYRAGITALFIYTLLSIATKVF